MGPRVRPEVLVSGVGANGGLERVGLGLFALTGPLSLGGLWLRGPIVDQRADPAHWAAVSASDNFSLAWALLLPSLVIQLLGWAALWSYLQRERPQRVASWAFVLSVLGNALWLPSAGVLAFVSPSLARLHLAGDKNALGVLNNALFGSTALPIMAVSAASLLLGSVLFAIAIWRSPGLPRWTAPPYALHALCLTFLAVLSYSFELAGAIMLLASTAAIAWRALCAQADDEHR